MNCEEAANLICARMDGELAGDDTAAVALDAHLAECAGCRAAAEAMQLQDAALVRAFAPGRVVAEAVAERAVAAAFADERTPVPRAQVVYVRPPRLRLWLTGAAASTVAACVIVAAATWGPRLLRTGTPQVVTPAPQPFAQIALSTGDVFTCPSHGPQTWQPVGAGAALAEGDRVRTGPSARVEVRLADGSQVRLNGDTEACLAPGRIVDLKQGQLWSAVPQESQPLRVTASPQADGGVTATTPPGSRLDFACASGESVVTAVHGPAKVTGKGGAETIVPPGAAVTIVAGLPSGQSTAGDILLATGWLNDLLLLKGRDDPELNARVNELLSRVKAEGAASRPATAPAGPGPVEQYIRAQGDQWSSPMACYVQSPQSQSDRSKRLTAARLLSDLAPPWAIPDLIALLGDGDGEVRFHAAAALHRLTGQTLGLSAAQCATDEGAAAGQAQKQWQAWWEQNKGRYAGRDRK